MSRQILDLLKAKDVKYKENINLSELSAIKIGGPAPFAIYPSDAQRLGAALKLLRDFGLCHKVLGRMSNVLPPDGDYPAVLVKTDGLSELRLVGDTVFAGAGVSLPRLSLFAARASLSGAEELSGIPASLGGAVFGNAGAYGREISELIWRVWLYIPETGEIVCLAPDELGFGYRKSGIREIGGVVISAEIRFSPSESGTVFRRISEYREKRLKSSPRLPSLGSTFKRPSAGYASKMIDECGLRGYRIGGAEISAVHAGYIVNLGGATSSDVKALADVAAHEVFLRFGVRLEREIEYL